MRGAIRALGNPEIAAHSARFFKTGPGEYGEGDRFLGVRVPDLRRLLRQFQRANLSALRGLLRSRYHEERLFAALMLAHWCTRADVPTHQRIYEFYLREHAYINNWDIVDGSASQVVGAWLWQRDRAPLYELAASDRLWDRRIAVIATLYFIRNGDHDDTLKLARVLLDDEQDLMHKAVGWMLREVGKRDFERADAFLARHHARMPRTMLRYAIEHYPQARRSAYLRGEPG